MSARAVWVWLVALFAVLPAASLADETAPPANPRIEILDLVYTVEDLGGEVLDLEVKETESEIRIELAADVLFDFDKAEIRPDAESALHRAAEIIQANAKGVVRVEGHTDAKGSDSYNQKLSERRAGSVKDWLVKREGLTNVRFTTSGFGARKPVAPNTQPDGSDDPAGRQKNRRVSIVVAK